MPRRRLPASRPGAVLRPELRRAELRRLRPLPGRHRDRRRTRVVIAQKILSCVARVKERFGINHVISVLRGENTESVRTLQHDQLSTYGLLKDTARRTCATGSISSSARACSSRTQDEYPILKLNVASWEVMKGKQKVQLVQPVQKKKAETRSSKSRADGVSWEGVERDLFEALRDLALRPGQARRNKPPYVIFSDETLRQLARVRPSTNEMLRSINGIGDMKMRDLGPLVLPIIKQYCEEHGLAVDVP